MLVSIIIPIYNKEKTLKRTIESVLNQGLHESEYEVLLIDDGSKDHSLDICKQYEHRKEIKIFSKPNEGVSKTRNLGISLAEGEYVYFIDADDYLVEGGLRYLFDHFYDPCFDILDFQYTNILEKEIKNKKKGLYKGKIIKDTTRLDYLNHRKPVYIWHSLYKRSFLERYHLCFDDIPYSEDFLFNINVYNKNPKVRCLAIVLYHYVKYENGNNLSTKWNDIYLRNVIKGYLSIFKRMGEINKEHQSKGLPLSMKALFNSRLNSFTSRVLCSDISIKELKDIRNLLIDTKLYLNNNQRLGKNQKACKFVIDHPLLFPAIKLLYKRVFLPHFITKFK